MLLALAITLPLIFTTPDSGSASIADYIGERGNLEQGYTPAALYGSPALTPHIPRHTGECDTVWVVQSVDPNSSFGWRHGGAAYRIAAVSVLGDTAAWSNLAIIGTALPDTNVTDGRTWTRPIQGVARWSRLINDDDFAGGPVATEEVVQMRSWTALCEIYGYACLVGQRIPCTGPQP